jgi:ferredoxin
MAARVNPRLVDELERYGAQDVAKCYHCGNCSAVCPFSREPFLFPRRSMRFLQLGLEDRLRGTLEPWLCYYCGECSDQCPRGAEPGETMMSVRRWLTAQYDLTGLSRLFYRSWKAEVLAIVILALVVGAALVGYGLTHGSLHVYDGPGAFLPSDMIHHGDWILAGGLALLLGINCANMWWLTLGRRRESNIRLADYLRPIWMLPWHFFTQARYRECDRREPWLRHLVLVLSYVTMFVLIVFFLPALQEGPAIRWDVHALGYLATIGLITTVVLALRSRYRKAEPLHRHSHETDWIFLVLLLLVAVTGIVQHALHRAGALPAANVLYVVHLMIAVPMLLIEVPFGKWAHLAYRPLAMYLAAVETAAMARKPGRAPESERARAA